MQRVTPDVRAPCIFVVVSILATPTLAEVTEQAILVRGLSFVDHHRRISSGPLLAATTAINVSDQCLFRSGARFARFLTLRGESCWEVGVSRTPTSMANSIRGEDVSACHRL